MLVAWLAPVLAADSRCGRPFCGMVFISDQGEVLVHDTEGASSVFDAGLGFDLGSALFSVIYDSSQVRSLAVEWHVATSFGLSGEGPHFELEDGPFGMTDWAVQQPDRPGLWHMPPQVQPLPRPVMTRDEIIAAFAKRTGGSEGWVDMARACAPDCPIGIDHWSLKLVALGWGVGPRWEHVVKVRNSRGC